MPLSFLKKLIAAAVLGGATVFGLAIIGRAYIKSAPAPAPQPTIVIKPNNPSESLPQPQKISALAYAENTADPVANTGVKTLADKIAGELNRLNPNGPSLIDGKPAIAALKPEDLANKLISEEFKNFDYGEFKQPVDPKKLLILGDASPAAVQKYIRETESVIKRMLNDAAASQASSPPSVQDLSVFVEILDAASAKLYLIPTPKTLASWHGEEIALLNTEIRIFKALTDFDSDPLKALRAYAALPIMQNEADDLFERFVGFAKEI